VSTLNAVIPKGGSLLDRVGTKIYLWWFGFRDRTGAFRKSNYAEGVAASRFQSHRIYLRTIWLEVRNVRHRIALLHRNKLHRYGICLQTASERLRRPDHQRCTYRQVRIENIRTLLTIHPGATLVDLYLLADMVRPCLSEEDCRMATENRHGEEHIHSYKTRMEPGTNKLPGKLPT
jgi:hypothetical protein